MSEESDVIDDHSEVLDISDVDEIDTNVDDLEDIDKLLVTTNEESIILSPFEISNGF